jgi:methylaspartate ammonia-lyase
MVLKRPDILPHTYFTDTDELGPDGSGLVDYVSRMSARVAAIGGEGYRPSLHLDFYGMLGDLYDQDLEKVVSLIGRAADAAAPLPLLIETPILEASQDRQIARMNILKRRLRQSGIQAELIADDWCNTLDDIRKFCAGEASDYVQIKMPDLGGINHSIEAVLHCKTHGMGAFLGGSANETDQSARISVHIALASSPAFIGSKPGLGGDEALMIQFNEMSRTLALIASKPWRAVV